MACATCLATLPGLMFMPPFTTMATLYIDMALKKCILLHDKYVPNSEIISHDPNGVHENHVVQ